MKVLITGVSGLAGSAVYRESLKNNFTVCGLYNQHNYADFNSNYIKQSNLCADGVFEDILENFHPDVVINTAAISTAADVENDKEISEIINTRLPGKIAESTKNSGIKFVHISTDMVFDGKKGNYSEGDSPNPKSLYGWQKLKAEEIILEKNPNAAIVRTAIISGNSPSCTRSIHERLFQEWANGRIPVLFTDEFRQPVSSENLSQVLLRLAMNNSSGIFHWAGRDVLSRYEMGLGILDRFKIPGAFIKAVSIKSDSNNKDRPSDLTMDISKLKNELGILPESFSDQLLNMKIPAKFAEWYSKNSSLVVI